MNQLSNQLAITLFAHLFDQSASVLHTYSTNQRAITVFCIVYGYK